MRYVYNDGVLQSLDIQTKRMVGEVMTLMEASLPDTLATTALKKSIKQTMWRTKCLMRLRIPEFWLGLH